MSALCPLGDIELVLGNMLLEPNYMAYYSSARDRGRCLILDNGVMELGYALSSSELFDLIDVLRPSFVTPPEVLHDGPETMRLTNQFITDLDRRRSADSVEVLGVAHGSSLREWTQTFDALATNPRIARIGIPYDVPFAVPGESERVDQLGQWAHRRMFLTEFVSQRYADRVKDVHLLGLAHPMELVMQSRHTFIRSHDSSWPVMAAVRGINYDETLMMEVPEKPFIKWDVPWNDGQAQLAAHNVAITRQVIKSDIEHRARF
ncbi:hypothetical protein SAMN02745244_03113 [Tessaracoccus bendigoensis DSM 12906]|uniref:Uncharacterized protein n=2 Tax=Tessaracoccus TaxID=72763 RepID=A0A1M6LM49_9ACTN|nr:hypothetical protein SAMN02745244_03113 [Tessaracoccus bendigoensis DSM 12906]